MKKKCPLIVNRESFSQDTFQSELGECIEEGCSAWVVHRDPFGGGGIDKRNPGRCRAFDKDGIITHTRDWE